jgi:hypothetical protein
LNQRHRADDVDPFCQRGHLQGEVNCQGLCDVHGDAFLRDRLEAL